MNQTHITEFFDLIADGGLEQNDILAMSAEVLKAANDAESYLANDKESAYQAHFAIPLWEWVLIEQLEDGLLFRANKADALYAQIEEAFGDGELELTSAALKDLSNADALCLIQKELDPAYTLVNFSKPLNDEMQVLLMRSNKLDRFLALCKTLELAAAPSCIN
ncbi:hypothetical protein [Janthinobacterium sp. B9-8]|uniref:hypothetical protein n=1 Tax=Janthinobacterium sp. B9-8 TaxID=1236179 RepID=UPI00061D0EEB|nr:hypothetical protein [Janthinobacterium sp. B9-8]AMC34637.1 hypothetical protein VN23_08470 [Janthinobacterium sp. B9-8]